MDESLGSIVTKIHSYLGISNLAYKHAQPAEWRVGRFNAHCKRILLTAQLS
jgi:hypothetical protein